MATESRYAHGIGPLDARETGRLVDAARAGDRGALDRLLRENYDRVWAVCRRICGNDADAADAAQEALLSVVRGLPRFDGRASFTTWIYRVTTNACLDELRRRRRRPALLSDDATIARAVVSSDGDTGGGGAAGDGDPASDRIADRMLIDAALATLPEEFRVAVVLRDLCDLDYHDIAQVLDLPGGTVRSRIARGRAALAVHLRNQNDPPRRPNDHR